MKKLTAMLLTPMMVLSLAACSSDGGTDDKSSDNPGSSTQSGGDAQQSSGGKQDDIVLWTLAADLKQFTGRYEEQTGNHVEVVVFDSADFCTKIMQTLGGKSKDVFVGEPQMLPNFFEAGFSAGLSALAEEVFGTSDPEEIGKLFSSFDAICDTADKLQAKGCSIFADTGSLRWFST